MNNLLHMPHVFLWIAGSIILGLSGLFFFKKFCKEIDVPGNGEFLNATVAIVGTLVSVVIGLLVSSSVDQYRDIEDLVNEEAVAVTDVYRLARALPDKYVSPIQHLCIDYCDHTVADEWESMKTGQASESVTRIYAQINDSILALSKDDAITDGLQGALMDSTKDIAHNRHSRIAIVKGTWMWKLLPIVLMCAILLMAISYLYVSEKPSKTQMLLTSFVAVALGSNISLIVLMSRPFDEGACGISSDVFKLAAVGMRQFSTLERKPITTGKTDPVAGVH